MPCESESYTVERYIRGIVQNVRLSQDTVYYVMSKAGVEPGSLAYEMTQKEQDLCEAYLYLSILRSPSSSANVTDRDADWEHSEGSERWTEEQRLRFLALARWLLRKWGIDTSFIDGETPRWGFVGRNMRNREKRG